MAKSFTSFIEMEKYIESACEKAVQNACDRLLGKLKELLETEYYDVFDPEYYNRSYQFYKSAMTEMLTKTTGIIFMNPDVMNYPFSGRGWSWTGEQQIRAANEGIHGGWSTEESRQHRYWESFEEYCEQNALPILREELAKQGIKTTK